MCLYVEIAKCIGSNWNRRLRSFKENKLPLTLFLSVNPTTRTTKTTTTSVSNFPSCGIVCIWLVHICWLELIWSWDWVSYIIQLSISLSKFYSSRKSIFKNLTARQHRKFFFLKNVYVLRLVLNSRRVPLEKSKLSIKGFKFETRKVFGFSFFFPS